MNHSIGIPNGTSKFQTANAGNGPTRFLPIGDNIYNSLLPMLSTCESEISGYFRTWKFTHTLCTSLKSSASCSFASTTLSSYASAKQLLVSLLTHHKPSQITSIQLRVPRTTIDACVKRNSQVPFARSSIGGVYSGFPCKTRSS